MIKYFVQIFFVIGKAQGRHDNSYHISVLCYASQIIKWNFETNTLLNIECLIWERRSVKKDGDL